MKNDFIYDLMKSEEIREYYRKNIELDPIEQECVVINCYQSLNNQLKLLYKLLENVSETSKKDISDMIKLYELIIQIYNRPYEFFGNKCNIIYVLHYLELSYNINPLYSDNDLSNFFKYYKTSTYYYDNIEYVISDMNQNFECVDLFEIEIVISPKNSKSFVAASFYCNNFDGKFEPFRCFFERDLFNKYNLDDTMDRYEFPQLRYKGVPFESHTKVKFQVPGMNTPFYGILNCNKDLNNCWYIFMYQEGTKKEEYENYYVPFIDMSYTNISSYSIYALFDWLERA